MLEFLKGNKSITLFCLIAIAFLSLIPQKHLPNPHFSFEDLVVHVIMYAGLALCLSLTLYTNKKSRTTIRAFIFIVFFGISMELFQKYLPVNRFFSWNDIVANSCGGLFIFIFRKCITGDLK